MRETEAALQELPPKKDVALFLLQRSSVFVHLDPRSDDVIVPAGFKREPRLVLQVGHSMAVPIPDLTVNDDGWSGTLSFRRVPFRCVVPWTSVFAMVGQDGQGVVWPEDVPPELAQAGGTGSGTGSGTGQPAAAAAAPAPKLGLVPAPAPEPAAAKTTDDELAAVDTVDDAKKPKTKAKRTRKKADKADKADGAVELAAVSTPTPRPTPTPTLRLTLTPAAARSASPTPAATPVATPKAGPAEPSSPAPPAAPAQTFGGKGAKPKRELPPYLRVIK